MIVPQALSVFRCGGAEVGSFHKESRKLAVKCAGHPRCRADDLGIRRGRRETDQDMFVCMETVFPLFVRQPPYTIGTAPQSCFPQSCKLLHCKKRIRRVGSLQAFDQFLRFNIDKLHLIRLIKDRIRDPLPGSHAGDGSYGIVETFDVSHIYRSIHIDTGLQQFINILIPSAVTTACPVRVGQFIYEDQIRFSIQRLIQIKFFPAFNNNGRKLSKPIQKAYGLP